MRRGPLFIPSVVHGEYRVRAIRNRIYHRPVAETFHEFLVRMLVKELGVGWFAGQRKRPVTERHVLCRWIEEWESVRTSPPMADAVVAQDGSIGISPSGSVQALVSVAYDVAAVIAASPVRPSRTISRLKDRATFQGARYELAVARIFATAGYELEWSEREQSLRHPEFVARCTNDGFAISVEAKSRRRRNVLDSNEGPQPDREELRVLRLLREALGQAPVGMPFAVFIDANVPTPGRDFYGSSRWRVELQSVVGRLRRKGTGESPHEFSLLIVTNWPWHYAGQEDAGRSDAPVFCLPTHAVEVLDTIRFLRLWDATNAYPEIPDWV